MNDLIQQQITTLYQICANYGYDKKTNADIELGGYAVDKNEEDKKGEDLE